VGPVAGRGVGEGATVAIGASGVAAAFAGTGVGSGRLSGVLAGRGARSVGWSGVGIGVNVETGVVDGVVVGTDVWIGVSFVGAEVGWPCVSLAQATAARPIMSKQIAAIRFMRLFFLSHRFPPNGASSVDQYLTFSVASAPHSGQRTTSLGVVRPVN